MRYFDWDEAKAESNLRKHGVSLEEAITVFDDPLAGLVVDDSHPATEQRAIAVGYSRRGRLLLVAFVERGLVTRIISSRRATAAEKRVYERGV